jgi:hypothetical protein
MGSMILLALGVRAWRTERDLIVSAADIVLTGTLRKR